MVETKLVLNEKTIEELVCRHLCMDKPVGIYYVPEGCSCFHDPIQALCAYHLSRLPDVPCYKIITREAV